MTHFNPTDSLAPERAAFHLYSEASRRLPIVGTGAFQGLATTCLFENNFTKFSFVLNRVDNAPEHRVLISFRAGLSVWPIEAVTSGSQLVEESPCPTI